MYGGMLLLDHPHLNKANIKFSSLALRRIVLFQSGEVFTKLNNDQRLCSMSFPFLFPLTDFDFVFVFQGRNNSDRVGIHLGKAKKEVRSDFLQNEWNRLICFRTFLLVLGPS